VKILIKTEVAMPFQEVYKGFNEELFLALKPPLLPLKLLRFDGCETGDQVHIELGFGKLTQRWDALIIDHNQNNEEFYFVDKGVQLPFFLKKWQHRHRILKSKNGAAIIDDIDYQTPYKFLDYLMYPIMYFQFYLRKPVYKKVFS